MGTLVSYFYYRIAVRGSEKKGKQSKYIHVHTIMHVSYLEGLVLVDLIAIGCCCVAGDWLLGEAIK